MKDQSKTIQDVGCSFDIDKYLNARKLTIEAVKEVSALVCVGMTEDDGQKLIDEALARKGVEKKWHPTKFRIGKNTVKSFREKSDEGVTLKEDDLFFIDIGPVFDGHEGDYGETFVTSNNPEYLKIKKASEDVFHTTANKCRDEGLTGVELYEFAQSYARDLGYELNLKMSGHRLADFPHAVYFRGSLGSSDIKPKKNLWILEIHIRHPENEYGAFFEDLI